MKKRLVWIGMILLALCLAAYWIVPNWILAKPREALIEQIHAQLQTDWQSEAVAFAVCLYHPAGFIEHRRFLRCGGRGNAVPIRKDRTKKCREVGVCTRNEKQKATASGF